jgi:hypothetical protein
MASNGKVELCYVAIETGETEVETEVLIRYGNRVALATGVGEVIHAVPAAMRDALKGVGLPVHVRTVGFGRSNGGPVRSTVRLRLADGDYVKRTIEGADSPEQAIVLAIVAAVNAALTASPPTTS